MKRRKYIPVPKVYIQFREYDYSKGTMRHCKGKTIIVERATPDAVHALVMGALKEAHDKARKARIDGEKSKEAGAGSGGRRERDGGSGSGSATD